MRPSWTIYLGHVAVLLLTTQVIEIISKNNGNDES